MTRHRRLELLDWANHAGAAVVEDDYDGEFRHTARPSSRSSVLIATVG